MNLLAKEYFSLQEISNIWAVSRDDLLYYGENNILEISVRPAAIAAGIERVCYIILNLQIILPRGKASAFPLNLYYRQISTGL